MQQEITGASLSEPADCTLACENGHTTAHKLVLCNHSKYLQDILSKHPTAEHPIIILTELNISDIKILVNYMYTGELVINSAPSNLLRAAQILKISSLTEDISQDNNNDPGVPPEDDLDDDLDDDHDLDDDLDDDVVDDMPDDCGVDNSHHGVNDVDEEDMDEMDDDDEHQGLANDHYNRMNDNIINSIKNIFSLNQSLSSSSSLHNSTTASSINSHKHTPTSLESSLSNKNNKIKCHLCNIGLSDVKCLYRHVLTRHLPEKWGYKCEFCDREFSRDDHLMRHYTTKHKNMEFNREKIRETRRLNREMAKNFHDQISTI